MIAIGPDEPDWLAAELADDVPPVTGRTQIEKVCNALLAGAETSEDVAALTGLTVKLSAAYLYRLRQDGVVRLVSSFGRRYRSGAGSHVYALAGARP